MVKMADFANRNEDGDKFPLLFAKQICVETGLWDSLEESDSSKRYYQNQKLKHFQQMSITCKFKDSLIAFHGQELTEDHVSGLEVIHKATKAWLKGEVVGVLMEKIASKKIANKDFAASIAVIMSQLDESEDSEKTTKTKQLICRMANMKDVTELGERYENE